jgi:spermidine/putrescine-binding protein
MWIETLGIPKGAKNIDEAKKYIKYMQRPDVQAKLTWRKAYRSNTPSIEGIKLLSPEQQNILKVKNGDDGANLVNAVKVRLLPTDASNHLKEQEWQTMWQNFKAE